MLPEDIQKLRKELACTARELAATLGVDPKEVAAWEAGELFPTKRHVEAMESLRARGKDSIVRSLRPKERSDKTTTGLARLNDPALWRLLRKLIAHPAFFEEAQKLSEKYAEPE